jgi:hypothetical protein
LWELPLWWHEEGPLKMEERLHSFSLDSEWFCCFSSTFTLFTWRKGIDNWSFVPICGTTQHRAKTRNLHQVSDWPSEWVCWKWHLQTWRNCFAFRMHVHHVGVVRKSTWNCLCTLRIEILVPIVTVQYRVRIWNSMPVQAKPNDPWNCKEN